MWQPTPLETYLVQRLHAELPQTEAERLSTSYNQAKDYLCQNIYGEIARQEPHLTRHDENHVAAVLSRAGDLLIAPQPTMPALDLYLLAMAILFHDVGNITGREGHSHSPALSQVFTDARGNQPAMRRERTLVLAAVRAHGGRASDGTHDTLRELNPTEPLYARTIALQTVAAVLRFADELAEGPERTSEFCRMTGRYDAAAQIYHDYASISHVAVDRLNGRIMLNYEIDISEGCPSDCTRRDQRGCPCVRKWNAWINGLLSFTFGRIVKLDQERRYAKYYASPLSCLTATEVSMNFHWRSAAIPIDLPPIRLDEKVVPGDDLATDIRRTFPAYKKGPLLSAMGSGLRALEQR